MSPSAAYQQHAELLRGATLGDLSKGAVVSADTVTFPGARTPDRTFRVDVGGLTLAGYEWGAPERPPVLLVHGGFDFARTFDVFAGYLVDAGFRVVAWDQRNHGDSDPSPMTGFNADFRDAAIVVDTVSKTPFPIIGHSKGGSIGLRLAEAWPHRFSHVINIDGIPTRRNAPDMAETERARQLATDVRSWLDLRRDIAGKERKPDTFEGLARRRARMNPRLTHEWLCHLVATGARQDADGWRWKVDPLMRMGGFGPYRPEWSLESLYTLGMPFFGILATVDEPMGWGTRRADLAAAPANASIVEMPETGHFVHIERPEHTAGLVLEFLAAHGVRP
jgi:pimeloyl-ACP methyl ester carboxylesterase